MTDRARAAGAKTRRDSKGRLFPDAHDIRAFRASAEAVQELNGCDQTKRAHPSLMAGRDRAYVLDVAPFLAQAVLRLCDCLDAVGEKSAT